MSLISKRQTLLIATKSGALAANLDITLLPNAGPPTTAVKVKGAGFKGGEMVSINFDTTLLATIMTSTTGMFSLTISVPQSAQPGNHTVYATGQTSGRSAQATFLVQTNWTVYGFNLHGTRFNPYENVLTPANVSNLVLDWNYSTNGSIISSPAIANGVVYVGSDDHNLYAFNAITGVLLWSYTTGNDVRSSPAVANGVVYVGSLDHNFYALNATTGTLLWSYTTGNFIESPPLIAKAWFKVSTDQCDSLNSENNMLHGSTSPFMNICFSPIVT